jgi:hypothetical protein
LPFEFFSIFGFDFAGKSRSAEKRLQQQRGRWFSVLMGSSGSEGNEEKKWCGSGGPGAQI